MIQNEVTAGGKKTQLPAIEVASANHDLVITEV